jgi:hypothetical protein
LKAIEKNSSASGPELEWSHREGKTAGDGKNAGEDEPAASLPPTLESTTRITITSATEPSTAEEAAVFASAVGEPDKIVFQYSAMSGTAVIPVREVQVKTYFAQKLPERLHKAASRCEQEAFGKLFTNYMMPEDFRVLIEGDSSLTLVLDATTASYPWEMAGYKGYRETGFFGPDLRLTRQFRAALLSSTPGIAPMLNHDLKVLVIADPAPHAKLEGARAEGLAVIEVLKLVKEKLGDELSLSVVARIGPDSDRNEPSLAAALERIRGYKGVVTSAGTCDPLEVLALLVNEEFDVVHYAGHGEFKQDSKGWVFAEDCTLSAEEIFKVRQVPRLVFANACHSADVDAVGQQRQQVGLAEAFFRRGIENYIGTGWAVDDDQARTFATLFYSQALGVLLESPGVLKVVDTAPPATLGESLAAARSALLGLRQGNTWGAYQHYGQPNAKLVAFPNR